MRHARGVATAIAVFAGTTAIAASCSFPEINFGDAGSSGSGSGGASSASGSTTASSAGGGGAATASSAGGGGATSSTSSTTSTSATGTGGAMCDAGVPQCKDGSCSCDCDGDQHDSKGMCGGDDCDDEDSRAYPDEPDYYGTSSPTVAYDYDCDDSAERDPMLNKAVDCSGLGLPCSASIGFLGKVAPPCGGMGDWGTCKQNGLGCIDDVIETNKVMKCK